MKHFCIVSHTHWDREWYMPFEAFRLKLIDLVDRLLLTIEKYPDFVFHLDAQTIVLEDYLEIRPQNRDLLKKHIKNGNIIIGPWYLQNDFYLTSGESTVRNLLEGHKIAAEFGSCSKVGYAPDQFGNISQLPQILNNFDIHNFVFGRGFSFVKEEDGQLVREKMPTEFLWTGADGTKAIAVHMVYWYNNAQRFSEDSEKSKLMVETMKEMFDGIACTPYLLLMNGVDHLEAQDNLLPILEDLRPKLPDDWDIRQYRLDEYIEAVQKDVEQNKTRLFDYQGELRNGGDWELLKGTLSSRKYLKTENVKAQNMLECRLEPLYSMMESAGFQKVFPADCMHFLWKQLMKNHPHDSICGCSRDAVHAHMEDNYQKIGELSNELLARGLQTAALHMSTAGFSGENYILNVVNTTEFDQSGVVEAELQFPVHEKVTGFEIVDGDGTPARFCVLSKEQKMRDVFSPINLPGVLDVDAYRIYLYAENVRGFSFKGYIIRPVSKKVPLLKQSKPASPVLDNGILRVSVDENGKVDVTDQTTGITAHNALWFEESCDRGDAYVYSLTDDAVVLSSDFSAKVTSVEDNAFVQAFKIEYAMRVPAEYDFKKLKRSKTTVICPVTLTLTLKAGSRAVEVDYTIDNKAKDHRIRLVVNTGISSEFSLADIPFDLVRHQIDDHFPGTMSKVFPNTSFAAIEEKGRGFAVLTEGEHEYEHLTQKGELAFTLVRATGVITRTNEFKCGGGEYWVVPENQCLRTVTGRMALLPYSGDAVAAGVLAESKKFRNRPLGFFTSCDPKKFAGGRFAVQDSRMAELFYLPDNYENNKIADNRPLLKVDGTGVVVSAFKNSLDAKGLIVRLVNYSDSVQSCSVEARGSISRTRMAEDTGELLGAGNVTLEMRPKEIVTLRIQD